MATLSALIVLVTLALTASSARSNSGGWAEFRAFADHRTYLIQKDRRVRERRCLQPRHVFHRNMWFRGRPGLYTSAVRSWRGKVQTDRARARVCSPRELGQRMAARRGWTDGNGEWDALDELWGDRESGWNPCAFYPRRSVCGAAPLSACGIPQANPCPFGVLSRAAAHVRRQIRWGLDYIAGRHGSPSGAIAFHNARGWY